MKNDKKIADPLFRTGAEIAAMTDAEYDAWQESKKQARWRARALAQKRCTAMLLS